MSGGRPPKFYRYERIRQGLPVCASDNGCHNAPNSNGYCRSCWDDLPHERRPYAMRGALGSQPQSVSLPIRLFQQAKEAASALRPPITASEWVRRAVAEKLGQTPASSGS